MRLYLSSYRLGRGVSSMLEANSSNTRIAVIQNAHDGWSDPVKRRSVLERECRDLESLGLTPIELDLRLFFGKQDELKREIGTFGYCWVCGGNTFVLRRAFHLSGFDQILLSLADQDDCLTYGGYSAGACVMTPTLEGIHLADDPAANPEGYKGEAIRSGLGIYPCCIAPHYKSDHPETELIDKSADYFIQKKIPFIALRDGEAILFDTKTRKSTLLEA